MLLTRTNGLFQPWTKRWVVFQQPTQACELVVYSNDNPRSWKQLVLLTLDPRLVVVYRAFSKTRSYVLCVAISNQPQLYLAGRSEAHIQSWMAAVRDTLWPPSPSVAVEKSLAGSYLVSVIDNSYSIRAGLLGTYGHLSLTDRKLTLCHPQTGHVVQEWYLRTLKRLALVPQVSPEDKEKVFAIYAGGSVSTTTNLIPL
ncbi:hypothetical protein LAZ67_7003400 [Cordylochernes scorpioides]|uniref:PH domain-containing protein n=1 Tax=Cordylochernes scorpioides TaxID=51811 RepID=A0ABY6KSE3_9ARAC|nr:hypothetical protein LAZ67_7003400 [Cordylochernes scorpioides]